jgi:hypothetical protein
MIEALCWIVFFGIPAAVLYFGIRYRKNRQGY